jgi:hypothetical protein
VPADADAATLSYRDRFLEQLKNFQGQHDPRKRTFAWWRRAMNLSKETYTEAHERRQREMARRYSTMSKDDIERARDTLAKRLGEVGSLDVLEERYRDRFWGEDDRYVTWQEVDDFLAMQKLFPTLDADLLKRRVLEKRVRAEAVGATG